MLCFKAKAKVRKLLNHKQIIKLYQEGIIKKENSRQNLNKFSIQDAKLKQVKCNWENII